MQDNLQTDLRNDPAPVSAPVRRERPLKKKRLSLLDILILVFILIEIILIALFAYHYFTAISVG